MHDIADSNAQNALNNATRMNQALLKAGGKAAFKLIRNMLKDRSSDTDKVPDTPQTEFVCIECASKEAALDLYSACVDAGIDTSYTDNSVIARKSEVEQALKAGTLRFPDTVRKVSTTLAQDTESLVKERQEDLQNNKQEEGKDKEKAEKCDRAEDSEKESESHEVSFSPPTLDEVVEDYLKEAPQEEIQEVLEISEQTL